MKNSEIIYEKIKIAYLKNISILLHKDYPEDLLESRIHHLYNIPLCYTGNYICSSYYLENSIYVDRYLCIDKKSLKEASFMVGWVTKTALDNGMQTRYEAIREFESMKFSSKSALFFPIFNDSANDVWDEEDFNKTPHSPFVNLTLNDVGLYKPDPLAPYLEITSINQKKIIEYILELKKSNRILMISSENLSLITKIHSILGAINEKIGSLQKYHETLASKKVIKHYHRANKNGSKMKILLKGRIYEQ